MSDRVSTFFSDADREAIRDATAAAEGRTSGEIVSYVIERCDAYEEGPWKGATLGALAAAAVATLLYVEGGYWGAPAVTWIALPATAGAAIGFLLTWLVPGLRRLLTGAADIEQRVTSRAAMAFLSEEVFNTRGRTGILIFLALFEHRVVILGDEGINRQVATEEWEGISSHLAEGIRRGRPAAALVEAIEACGRLLEERGVERPPDDVNELGDHLRIHDA